MEDYGGDSSITKGPSKLELKDVTFSYPNFKKTFGPLSFSISPGSKIAIHGSNGSGKSTLIDLIYGFKYPSSGYILFNGDNIHTYEPETYRERVALIRGVEVIHGSIIKNLRLVKPSVSLGEIKTMLYNVGLLDEILKLPNGLDTILSEDGAPLTVAQMKQLMLARAILREPSLLLIDEAFDGLDDETRNSLLNYVFSDDAPWTVVVTSLHPEIEKRCDRVLNLDIANKGFEK